MPKASSHLRCVGAEPCQESLKVVAVRCSVSKAAFNPPRYWRFRRELASPQTALASRRAGPVPYKTGENPSRSRRAAELPSQLEPQSQSFTHWGAALHSLAAITTLGMRPGAPNCSKHRR